MQKAKAFWPEGHEKGETMARLAMAAHTILGFDAVRVPFCQTFEAHALGCMIKPGRGVGGVDTATTLFLKDADSVRKTCEESIADGIQILAPGCAVAPGTPLENLLAMVEVAKAH